MFCFDLLVAFDEKSKMVYLAHFWKDFYTTLSYLIYVMLFSVFTMGELRLTGNCLKGSRPIISFDENFEKEPHFALLKEMFVQVPMTIVVLVN